MRKKDGGFRMPDPAVVAGRRCVVVNIPDDVVHRANFWGALNQLARASNYDASRLSDSYAVAEMWLQVIETARIAECAGGEMDCNDILACIETTPQWQQITTPADITMTPAEIENFSAEQDTARQLEYDGTAGSILTDPVNDNTVRWSNNAGWQEALTAFVIACFEAKLNQMRQIEGLSFIANLLLGLAVYLETGYWLVKLGGWSFIPAGTYSTYGYDQLWDALQNEENLKLTVSGMLTTSNSSGVYRDVDPEAFQRMTEKGTQWTANADMPVIKAWMRDEILNHPLMWQKNYLLLLDAIRTANKHKLVDGDPMWRAAADSWEMKRGTNFSLVGVSALTGSVNAVNGFEYLTDGVYRRFDIAVTSPTVFKVSTFALSEYSATQSPIRPTEITVKVNGFTNYQNTNDYPNNSSYYFNMNAEARVVRFTANFQESGQWVLPPPFHADLLTMTGTGKPPVGYWTPD